MSLRSHTSSAPRSNRGSVLIIVIWVCLGAVALALYSAQGFTSEFRAADYRVAELQARQAVAAGTRYAAYQLTQYATSGKVMWGSSANALVNEADDPNITTNHALTVSGLAPNTTYYFQATSADSTGQAHSSQILSVTTLPQWTISGISAQASRTGATIQWTTAAYPTSGYVNWGLSSSGLTNQSAMAAVGNGHSIGLSCLSPATTYYYQVVASDGLGQSQSSPIQSFTTAADWGISGFAGLATRNSVTLSWQTSDQVTAGSILWGTSSALGNAAPEGSIASTNHQMVVSGLAPDTDYYFQVLATDPTGVSKTSNLILVHTALDWTIGGFLQYASGLPFAPPAATTRPATTTDSTPTAGTMTTSRAAPTAWRSRRRTRRTAARSYSSTRTPRSSSAKSSR